MHNFSYYQEIQSKIERVASTSTQGDLKDSIDQEKEASLKKVKISLLKGLFSKNDFEIAKKAYIKYTNTYPSDEIFLFLINENIFTPYKELYTLREAGLISTIMSNISSVFDSSLLNFRMYGTPITLTLSPLIIIASIIEYTCEYVSQTERIKLFENLSDMKLLDKKEFIKKLVLDSTEISSDPSHSLINTLQSHESLAHKWEELLRFVLKVHDSYDSSLILLINKLANTKTMFLTGNRYTHFNHNPERVNPLFDTSSTLAMDPH